MELNYLHCYRFETQNGIAAESSGTLKKVDNTEVLVKKVIVNLFMEQRIQYQLKNVSAFTFLTLYVILQRVYFFLSRPSRALT
ncbi:putative cuticle protein, partial [Operophtera brumata]